MTIPKDAVEAAKEAMREVTPPPGVSKAHWLAEHGNFALIAGAIAAAAPHIQAQALRDAAGMIDALPIDDDGGAIFAQQLIAKQLRARANTINPETQEPR